MVATSRCWLPSREWCRPAADRRMAQGAGGRGGRGVRGSGFRGDQPGRGAGRGTPLRPAGDDRLGGGDWHLSVGVLRPGGDGDSQARPPPHAPCEFRLPVREVRDDRRRQADAGDRAAGVGDESRGAGTRAGATDDRRRSTARRDRLRRRGSRVAPRLERAHTAQPAPARGAQDGARGRDAALAATAPEAPATQPLGLAARQPPMSEPLPNRRSGWRRIGAVACAAAVVAAVSVGAPARASAPYVLRTNAVYRVDPAAGAAGVMVSVTFTSTTPDPPGGFSSFRSVPHTLQADVSNVVAHDRAGSLRVTLARQASRTVATVALRAPLRYRRSASFTMTYRLADGADPHVRVRASSLMVPIWGFGTSSTVSVHLPAGYESRVIGGPLATTTQQGAVVLSSGAIRDPSRWS